ncbi:hypothetical protein [Streptomyces sp. NPDC091278]|uniref:phage distal tail protein n=1 Tax=Streptomyces sp. NPDC091278 TaxID=3155301 RepID=UPI00344E46E8
MIDYQIDFAGVLLGPGTVYPIGDVTGLGAPELRTQDVDLATEDGALPGVDLYRPRVVGIEAGIRTPGDPAAAASALAALNRAAATPTARLSAGALQTLLIRWPGHEARQLYGRVRRVETVSTRQSIHGWIPIALEFTATDPSWHSPVLRRKGLPLAHTPGTGFRAPITAPISTGVAVPEERPGWLDNAGDRPAWPTITITGPVVNPRIRIAETSSVLDLQLDLADGQTLVIETRPGTRTVLRDGVNASGALSVVSRLDLFTVPPGRSEIRWTGANYTNRTRLSIAWHDAHTTLGGDPRWR